MWCNHHNGLSMSTQLLRCTQHILGWSTPKLRLEGVFSCHNYLRTSVHVAACCLKYVPFRSVILRTVNIGPSTSTQRTDNLQIDHLVHNRQSKSSRSSTSYIFGHDMLQKSRTNSIPIPPGEHELDHPDHIDPTI